MYRLIQYIRRYTSNALFMYCWQIFIVFLGTTLALYYLGYEEYIVPITLGTIAAALTDFDDRLSVRLRSLVYVCCLFFITSSILEMLATQPIFFIAYLSLSSAFFILLGSLGQRYAAISFGTILLSIYTMFGLGEYTTWYFQPACFVAGAIWYSLTSIIFYLLKPTLFVQDSLAQTFSLLSNLLHHKAKLFDPDNTKQDIEQRLYELSGYNSKLVQQLDINKTALLTRLKASRANKNTIYWLNLHFFAQDIHEQATSNYLNYEKVGTHFSRSDVIFRMQKNIHLTANAFEDLARSILQQQAYDISQQYTTALLQLEDSVRDWIKQHPQNIEVKNLQLISNNLHGIYEQLKHLNDLTIQQNIVDTQTPENINLLDGDIQDWQDLVLKFKQHLTPQSALFRHAVRIAFVFFIGYLVSLLPFAKNGYWILLTSLFVCQVSYFATKARLKMRTLGTILGVIIGMPILYFIHDTPTQLILTVICAVLFFYLRVKKYAIATLMATLMVLLIFSIKGAAYEIIIPRIADTLIGCFIAWFAVSFIWPDWQCRDISKNIKNSERRTMDYLAEISLQYQQGKNNSMRYRTARRFAHNAQTELTNMISSLSAEPHPDPELIHHAFRYLVYSHSQLSYISALGAQRNLVTDTQVLALIQWCNDTMQNVLLHEQGLSTAQIHAKTIEVEQLFQQERLSEHLQLVLKQINLLLESFPEFISLRRYLLARDIK
ncbi:YccS family putative transporter [Acinetobacter rathckeae]|uniref:YccS family putative transporter n=1 Tax=Acinetobacter rathckeae TaxID=2605272 RepID=UPI0018A2C189|nr:YccS family putative transporter [Acinetobacter rathckeae]MBF7688417.1 TIGR01666 family membrane protein [Acinetobacter rathckeae]MBF7695502.1 TIGR01666 family membrane protein [Acinetobacter rathckeae]